MLWTIPSSLREKSPNTEFFLIRIFPYSVQISEKIPYLDTFRTPFSIWTPFSALANELLSTKNISFASNIIWVWDHLGPLNHRIFSQIISEKQKQFSRGLLRKTCSENIQHIFKETPMLNCDFNKVSVKQHYWHHTSACVLSCKFAAYFQNTFAKITFWGLLLEKDKLSTQQL